MGGGKRHKKRIKKVLETDKIFEKIRQSEKFPFCYGKFPDCPQTVKEFQAREYKEEEIPRDCRICPYFRW